jgi:hypothetical protein
MNRFLKGLRAAPWAWMQTGPLTVDVEARLSNHDPEPERIPASTPTPARTEVYTEAAAQAECGALLPERIAERTLAALTAENEIIESAEPARPSEEPEPAVEDTKLTLDDFPALKAAIESFEKRGDPIMITVDTERSGSEPVDTKGDLPERAPKRRRAKANPAKRRSKRILKPVNLRPHAPKRERISANAETDVVEGLALKPPKTQAEIDLSHHKRHCTICQHPEREAIEEAFCQWRNVKFIAREFNATGGPSAIYRHARALKLFKQRNLTLRSSLEFVIEQSERIIPTAEGLVKAIRAYTRINDAGQWIDTPTTHIVQVIAMPAIDPRNLTNSVPGLTLNVRKHPSDIIESSTPQPLLPGSAPQVENAVTD